jgi:hypothetical protein
MNLRGPTHGTARAIATAALRCLTAAVCIVAATAVLVIATGLSDDARRGLGFRFGGVDHNAGEAARIALHNGRYAAATLACAVALPWLPRWARVLSDALLAALLTLNAAAIGVAYGAYRWSVIAATAPHLPLELAGVSLAGGAYLHTRRHPLAPRALIATATICALLLATAALIETNVSVGGAR